MMTRSIEDKIEVWIVNDSKFMTNLLSDLISNEKILVGTSARDGLEALRKLSGRKPDVILLDLEMPRMDGLTFIDEVVKQNKLVPIIVVSSFTQEGTKLVLDALENGALDFVPVSYTNPETLNELKDILISKIETAAKSDPFKIIPKNIVKLKPRKLRTNPIPESASKLIILGSSTGGPQVIQSIISTLPSNFDAGILVVQHMPTEFLSQFTQRLNKISDLEVKEAQDGDVIKNGTVLVAPGGSHIVVEPTKRVRLVGGPKRFGVKPSINMSMISASEVFGTDVIGVLLTGMGHDGAFGMKSIKKRGGKTIAQNKNSAAVYGMPKAAVELNVVDKSLTTEQIPLELLKEVEKID